MRLTLLLRTTLPALFLAVAAFTTPVGAQLRIDPPAPIENSLVKIEGLSGCLGNTYSYSFEVNRGANGTKAVIRVYDPGYLDPPLLTCPPAKKGRITVGPLAAGDYTVEHYLRVFSTDTLQASIAFKVGQDNNTFASADWAGIWWAPSQPGWAIIVDRDPESGRVFAAWFTHDTDLSVLQIPNVPSNLKLPPRRQWLVSPSMSAFDPALPNYLLRIQASLSGDVYLATANRSLFAVDPLNTFAYVPTKVGTMKLTFLDYSQATLDYSLNMSQDGISESPNASPRSGRVALRRFRY
jgi:hypothetical protein